MSAPAVITRVPWPVAAPVPRERVARPRLVRSLQDPGPPLVVLVAPAGYGKTALLGEWAEHDRRAFAWVTAAERDNEGVRLEAAVARALRAARSEPGGDQIVLVVDDAHRLHSRVALDSLAAIAADAGPALTVALASRRRLALPIARLREQRLVREVGPRELAMTTDEAASLLGIAGLDLDSDAVATLLSRTEGWPAALSLAALADPPEPHRFGGRDRAVAEYLRDEVLAALSSEQLDFVLETSVLDTLTAPACDAVRGRSGSSAVLAELAGSGLPLVALDRHERRYRHHRMVAEMLRAELQRLRPDDERELHRRASAWHLRAGDQDRAVHHAICAGDAGELVWSSVVEAIGHGRQAALDHWLGRFADSDIAAQPGLALAAAHSALSRGRGDLASYWTAAAASASSPLASGVALMRAALARDGVDRMRADAERAYELEPEDSPWRASCCLLAGTADLIAGRDETARVRLEEGARRAAVVAPDVHALCLTQLALAAIAAEDWNEAAELVARARAQVDRHALGDSAMVAVVFAMSALVRAHRGRTDHAQSDLDAALRLQATLTDFAPWYEIELRILVARAAVRLCDVGVARTALDEAERLIRRLPGAVALSAALAAARARHDTLAVGPLAGADRGRAPDPALPPDAPLVPGDRR